MRKYVLATHGKMAEGMLTTIEMLAGAQENLTCINAYTDECPDPLPELKRIGFRGRDCDNDRSFRRKCE